MDETPRNLKPFWVISGIIVLLLAVGGFLYGSKAIAGYYFKRGIQEFQGGNITKAKPLFEKALKFDSKNPEPHFYLGKLALGKPDVGGPLLYPNANYPEAVDKYEAAIALNLKNKNYNNFKEALNDAGFAHWMLKQYPEATAQYLELIELAPDTSFVARYYVALDYFDRSNKPAEALQILLPVFGLNTANLSVNGRTIYEKSVYRLQVLTARLFSYSSDTSSTKSFASAAISAAGDNANVDVQIAHLILAQQFAAEKNLKQALDEYQKADALAEKTFSKKNIHQCILGKIYYYTGDYSQAITTASGKIAGVTQFDYPKSICLETLARTYMAKRDKAMAKQYLERYLAVTAEFKEKNIFVFRNREEFGKALQDL
ncbi:MAG: hypothetical protein HYT39_02550 [Candidatus Sungbacteria bacterium]|nr:hypothetical protein [Candidatus Sungbacteria bacterium]